MRILTVVAGPGLVLDTPSRRHRVRPLERLAFDGAGPVRAHLPGGAVRALNLIWRPGAAAAGVKPLTGPARATLAGPAGRAVAVCAPAGDCRADGVALPAGTVALAPALEVALAAGAAALLVRPSPSAAPGSAAAPP